MTNFGPVSLSEMTFFTSRAAFGAGCSHGITEDLASTAVWLARQGIDPTICLAKILDHIVSEEASYKLEKVALEGHIKLVSSNENPASALFAAIAASDQLSVAQGNQITLENVDFPLFAAATLSALSSKTLALTMRYEHEGKSGDIAFEDGMDLTSMTGGDIMIVAEKVSELNDTKTFVATDDHHNIAVDQDGWNGILKHFKNSLVEATEASRLSGAGAGLVDTD